MPEVLDVGGYASRAAHIQRLFPDVKYTSANIGTAWYIDEYFDFPIVDNVVQQADLSHDFVISVDTLEHLEKSDREEFLAELVRLSRLRTIVVFPFDNGGQFFEKQLLSLSERWEIASMPSLVEHTKFGLPDIADIELWCSNIGFSAKFETHKELYWQFQIAMLIVQASVEKHSESVNRSIQQFMEAEFASHPEHLSARDAYRVVLTLDKKVQSHSSIRSHSHLGKI